MIQEEGVSYDLEEIIREFKKIRGVKNKQAIFKQGFAAGFGMGFMAIPIAFLTLLGVVFVLRTFCFN